MTLDLPLLKQLARSEVARHLEACPHEKDLIIEASLMKPLERVIGVSALKERGVSKIFSLESTTSSQSPNVVYIVSPDVISVKSIINHIKIDNLNEIYRNRWVLFYPGRSIVTDYLLETEGVMGDVILDELELNFIPLESEVLSMEYPLAFKQLYVNRTHVPLYSVARALFNFQSLYGQIPKIYTIGTYSFKLVQLFKQSMFAQLPSPTDVPTEIGQLIIIDRNIDPVTVCSSQITFEGLLADIFTIKSGFVRPPDFDRKFLLSDQDTIFNEIRDSPLTLVAPTIRSRIDAIMEKQEKLKGHSVTEMKEFLTNEFQKLKLEKKDLDTYLSLCECVIGAKNAQNFHQRLFMENSLRNCEFSDDINKSIEWQIVKQSDILSTLKLLCLWNCTRSGGSFLLSDKATKLQKSYRDMFLQSYGFEHLSTFYNLERSGFFTNFNPEEKNFKNAVDDFELIPKTPPKNGPDISDVFSGMYRPFSSTLIEKIISNNFPKVDCSKFFASGIQSTVFGPDDKITEYAKNVTAVLYLGGVCHSEISCLRILSKKYNKRIILLTTSVINGSDIMQMHTETI